MDKSASGFGKSFKRLIIFQFKLAADALRDFLLSPISILMFILDLVLKPDGASYFDRLMAVGRKSDHLINLFEEHSQSEQSQKLKPVDSIEVEKPESE
jgi:hypothetical protein